MLNFIKDDAGAFESHFKHFSSGIILEVKICSFGENLSLTAISQFTDLKSIQSMTHMSRLRGRGYKLFKACYRDILLMPSRYVRGFRKDYYHSYF